MAFRNRSQAHVRSPRRLVIWGVGPENDESITLGTTAKQLWNTGIALTSGGKATIVRIRGDLSVFLTSVAADGDGFSGAVGLGIVTADAFAIGPTACPGAFTDPAWDGWMWHSYFYVFGPSQAAAEGAQPAAVQRITIDSKAMRKFDET